MMKKIISIGLISLLSCTMLTACSNAQNNNSSSSNEKTTTVKKSSKITTNNLTTKKQTAITIAYAGEKYPDIWKKTFKQAQNNSVVVKLHNRKNFSYMKNSSDIAYEIATVVNISITQRMIQRFSSSIRIRKLDLLMLK